MACNLKRSSTVGSRFTSKVGNRVTLTLNAQPEVNAEIIHVTYSGQDITNPPFIFTIEEGMIWLTVLVESTLPGAELMLTEDCGGGSKQCLDAFHYDPGSPAIGYKISGTADDQ